MKTGMLVGIGVAMALAATSFVVTRDTKSDGSTSSPFKGDKRAPNDDGPVIDSTRESKRARRRRMAKEKRK